MMSALVVPSCAPAMVASMESVISSDAVRNFPSSSGVFSARMRSKVGVASKTRASGSAFLSAI